MGRLRREDVDVLVPREVCEVAIERDDVGLLCFTFFVQPDCVKNEGSFVKLEVNRLAPVIEILDTAGNFPSGGPSFGLCHGLAP